MIGGPRSIAWVMGGLLAGVGPAGLVRAAEPGADETTRVLVLPPRLSGELPADTASQVRSIVADNLVDDGVEVLAEGEVTCEDAGCVGQAIAEAGAGYAVGTQVVGGEDEYTVVVTLHGADGEVLAPFEDGCSICGFVEVRDLVRLRALDARAELMRQHSEAIATPQPVLPVPQPVAVPARRSALVPAGWALAGAGAAATIGGAVLLGLHHQGAGCLDNPRGGECVPVRFTTAPAGGAVLGAGVLAATAGVVMVVLGRRAERPASSAHLRPAPGGVVLRF